MNLSVPGAEQHHIYREHVGVGRIGLYGSQPVSMCPLGLVIVGEAFPRTDFGGSLPGTLAAPQSLAKTFWRVVLFEQSLGIDCMISFTPFFSPQPFAPDLIS